jgi:hypothetical protein
MRLRALSTIAIAIAAALAAPAAFAQTDQQSPTQAYPERQKMLQACGQDIQTFCSGVQPGQGRIAACLKPHMRDLSPDCKGELVAARAKHKQMQEQQPQ